ncbi:DNA fragmentation factor subunit beta isoform X2 [Daktulosphaira vitifoliae]|uniref:DNA fragmentation factor subunit beta isoform X2 n=1 Tax=Daktulosphaira vitifoliae TaxID=58002 RepID=UPI0021AA4B33|nr:DNA fragmentation factor subunit beta isoform X2 [Daktulosphaira vitifoliae]
MRGYKISNSTRDKKFGIACYSFEDLRIKGCQKLKINNKKVTILLQDGTIIDDEEYFQTLPNQTLFIFRLNGENYMTGADIIYNALKTVDVNLLKISSVEIKSFMDENIKDKIRVLSSIIDIQDSEKVDCTILSLRSKHPQWFEDLDTRSQTKEEFMFKRSQERIRNYMYKTKADVKKSEIYITDIKQRHYLDEAFENFSIFLNAYKYNGHYFDRSNHLCLCDSLGTFSCEGAWNQENCSYERGVGHKINPYQSKETRIIFSTWNLDHWIERSRSIIPALFIASSLAVINDVSINFQYFYDLLFTSKNLKLVHIVCHNKGQHSSAKCDPEQFLEKKGLTNFKTGPEYSIFLS